MNRFGLLTLLAVLLLAAWNGLLVIVILVGLVLSTAGLAKLWSRLSLVGVHCQRILSVRRAFPGEHIELRIRLTNRKLLPLPWVQVDDEIPDRLAPADVPLKPGNRPGFRFLSNAASLLWYTGISWRHQLYCRKRGYYTLGSVTVSSGDIFGFYPRRASWNLTDTVIVYPKLFPVAQLGIPSLNPLGETRAERRIFEDPTRTIGVRDYSPHDSLRYVHWKASARQQKLQVKVFEPTTTLKAALFLAVDSFQGCGAGSDDNFELGISTAASVANYIVAQQHSSVGLFANTRLPDSGQPIRILPGGGTPQLVNILEALAMVVGSLDVGVEPHGLRIFDKAPVVLHYDRAEKKIALLLNGKPIGPQRDLVLEGDSARLAVRSLDCVYIFEIDVATGVAKQIARFEKDFTVTFKPSKEFVALRDIAVTINKKQHDWQELLRGANFDFLPKQFKVRLEGAMPDGRRVTVELNVDLKEPRIAPRKRGKPLDLPVACARRTI